MKNTRKTIFHFKTRNIHDTKCEYQITALLSLYCVKNRSINLRLINFPQIGKIFLHSTVLLKCFVKMFFLQTEFKISLEFSLAK